MKKPDYIVDKKEATTGEIPKASLTCHPALGNLTAVLGVVTPPLKRAAEIALHAEMGSLAKGAGSVIAAVDNDNGAPFAVAEVAALQRDLTQLKAVLEILTKATNKELDTTRKFLLPSTLGHHNLTGGRVDGVGLVSLRSDLYVTRKSGKTVGDVAEWLIEEGLQDLVQETVNASSLKSAVKKRIKAGMEDAYPGDVLQVEPYDYTVILK